MVETKKEFLDTVLLPAFSSSYHRLTSYVIINKPVYLLIIMTAETVPPAPITVSGTV